ncbi:lysine exporter LysO family protein [Burkholderia singularis]|uniref:Putative surface protein n=1 Tax=Burkholderia singularis TaxID=1503053 RepID=A0A238H665_9BURK|nr:lysine exporter LysO family protein [Burkholderia singularis]SMG00670.1 Putative surface protein [Burkholderia singularis]
MQTLDAAILPILIALLAGYVSGRIIGQTVRTVLVRLIAPLVWLLLLSIGHEFGHVLSQASEVGYVVALALMFAALTTFIPWLLIVLVHRPETMRDGSAGQRHGPVRAILKPLKECAIALLMVAIGVTISVVTMPAWLLKLPLPSTNQLLYALIWLVGVDLISIDVNRQVLSLRTLAVPILVILGSWAGGAIASTLGGTPFGVALALSSGFGWFTLSGVLVAKYLGSTYGTVALLTDLFRELFAIVLLYSAGARFAHPCIGASGATALDSTLPIIKQTCRPIEIPVALVSGLILTLIAPFLITLFLMK